MKQFGREDRQARNNPQFMGVEEFARQIQQSLGSDPIQKEQLLTQKDMLTALKIIQGQKVLAVMGP